MCAEKTNPEMAVDPIKTAVLKNPEATGLALIITNDDYSKCRPQNNLPGTARDGEALKTALTELNFAVHWKQNASEKDLKGLINEISRLEFKMVQKYCCVMVVFAGHGNEGDILCMTDGTKVHIGADIVDPLLPGRAKDIGAIPKVFLIDACRGGGTTETVLVPRSSSSPDLDSPGPRGGDLVEQVKIAGKGEYILAYSTIPQHKAYEIEKGGIWLSTLVKFLDERQYLENLDTLLTMVSKKIKENLQSMEYFQQPQKVSTLNDIISLDPNDISKQSKGRKKIAANFSNWSTGPEQNDWKYTRLLSRYAKTHGLQEMYSDTPSYEHQYKRTYYSSTVTITGQGDTKHCASTLKHLSQEMSREDAAKVAYQTLTALAEKEGGGGGGGVEGKGATGTGQGAAPKPSNYQSLLDQYCKQHNGSQKSEFIEDHSAHAPIFKCTITCLVQGKKTTRDSETFFQKKEDAREMAAYRVYTALQT